MTEDSWHRARLIPTSGINGADEQERRAATALLAVIGAVREFGGALIGPLGAPDGKIETFTEVPFSLGERKCFPDGLIQVRHGEELWTALVEVRTGGNRLDANQQKTYLEWAGELGFDSVLTVSNEVQDTPQTPKAAGLHHCSWRQILATAAQQKQQLNSVDPNQAWLLGELIRYLEHTRSGVLELVDTEDTGPVRSVDLRDPKVTVLRTVLGGDSAVRMPPTPPTRRDLRLVRRLGAQNGSTHDDAGWYQDPDDPTQLRWWDGVGWTDRRYPAQPVLTIGDV